MYFHFCLVGSLRLLILQGEHMRFLPLVFALILTASCGQDKGGGGSGSSSTANDGSCSLNGRSVACETIKGADGEGIDLLDSMIEVPVKIQDTEMTFLSDKAALSQGRRIECRVAVKNGEIYRFALRGDRLVLMTADGTIEMDRLNDGSGINGTWVWKGYIDNGAHMIRQMTILGNSKVVMKTSCEL